MFLPAVTAWQALQAAKTFSPAAAVPVKDASLVPSSVSVLSGPGFSGSAAVVSTGATVSGCSAGFCEQADNIANAAIIAADPAEARVRTICRSICFIALSMNTVMHPDRNSICHATCAESIATAGTAAREKGTRQL